VLVGVLVGVGVFVGVSVGVAVFDGVGVGVTTVQHSLILPVTGITSA
jgi:hypothetical protein